jgi:hypothetical protein
LNGDRSGKSQLDNTDTTETLPKKVEGDSKIQITCNQTPIQSRKANINSGILGTHGAENVGKGSEEAHINEDIQAHRLEN